MVHPIIPSINMWRFTSQPCGFLEELDQEEARSCFANAVELDPCSRPQPERGAEGKLGMIGPPESFFNEDDYPSVGIIGLYIITYEIGL